MDGFIQLSDGAQLFFAAGPQSIADTVTIDHVALGLSRMCRYAGQMRDGVPFYSVAEHSALMAHHMFEWACQQELDQELSRRLALATLLHDATEAFLPDIPRPMKVYLPDYLHLEAMLMDGIALKWELDGLIWTDWQSVEVGNLQGKRKVVLDDRIKGLDNRILVDEKARVMADAGVRWVTDDLEPLNVHIMCMAPERAERFFRHTYGVFNNPE